MPVLVQCNKVDLSLKIQNLKSTMYLLYCVVQQYQWQDDGTTGLDDQRHITDHLATLLLAMVCLLVSLLTVYHYGTM